MPTNESPTTVPCSRCGSPAVGRSGQLCPSCVARLVPSPGGGFVVGPEGPAPLDPASPPPVGSVVREVEFGLVGRFVAVSPGGEVEVDHDYDGGGFDFWPLASVWVVAS